MMEVSDEVRAAIGRILEQFGRDLSAQSEQEPPSVAPAPDEQLDHPIRMVDGCPSARGVHNRNGA
jgi:hypothetical protein